MDIATDSSRSSRNRENKRISDLRLLAVTAPLSADPLKDESGKGRWRNEYRNEFRGDYRHSYRENKRWHWRAFRFEPHVYGFAPPKDNLRPSTRSQGLGCRAPKLAVATP